MCASQPSPPPAILWLNDQRSHVAVPATGLPLLDVLAAAGLPVRLRCRAWDDPALGSEPLLEAVGALAGPLEIVLNGRLASSGAARLRVQPGDEVVIGQPAYLRQRFAFFR